MKTALEFNGSPCRINKHGNVTQNGFEIPPQSIVGVCAWCSKYLNDELAAKGYKISHGICSKCEHKLN